jgi:hypothetical protein
LPVLFQGLAAALGPNNGRAAENDAKPHPNVVIVLADDLGYGDVGCYGAVQVKTPNVNRLKREGMRFTAAHSPASICTASRYKPDDRALLLTRGGAGTPQGALGPMARRPRDEA